MNEKVLIEKCKNGDDEAYSILVEDLLGTAYKTSLLILKSKEKAEDAVQNTLLEAYLSIMNGKEIHNFKAWFLRLIYTRSIDLYRKEKRLVFTNIETSEEAISKMKTNSTQNEMIIKENSSELLQSVFSLGEDYSVPILLYYYDSLSTKEIALILNENVNTIKSRLKRGRKKLSNLIHDRNTILWEVKANEI